MTRAPRRSGEAVAAQHRNAGPMKHRNTPRGGASNLLQDLLDQAYDEGFQDGYEAGCSCKKCGGELEGPTETPCECPENEVQP